MKNGTIDWRSRSRSHGHECPKLRRLGNAAVTALLVALSLLASVPSSAESLLGRREYAGFGERTTIAKDGKEDTISYRFDLVLFDDSYFLRFEFGGIVECFGEGPNAEIHYCADQKFKPPMCKGVRREDGIDLEILELVPPLHAWSMTRVGGFLPEKVEPGQAAQLFRWNSPGAIEPRTAELETTRGALARYSFHPKMKNSAFEHFVVSAASIDAGSTYPIKYATLAYRLGSDGEAQIVKRRGEVTIEQMRAMDAGEKFQDFVGGLSAGAHCLAPGERVDYHSGSIVKGQSGRPVGLTGEQIVAFTEREMREQEEVGTAPQRAQQSLARKQAILVLGGVLLLLAAAAMKLRGSNRAA